MITTPVTADLVRGAVELETTEDGVLPHRLPAWTRNRGLDAQLAMVETEPSGVRLAFRTAATIIVLRARRTQRLYAGLPARPDGRYDLVIDGEPTASATIGGGRTLTMDMTTGATTRTEGPSGTVRFEGLSPDAKEVELWLPHNETTELIELRTDAPVERTTVEQPRWVHHGSSISQGSNASGPTAAWPAIAARVGDHALTNLGFGGGALLDPFVARTIRDFRPTSSRSSSASTSSTPTCCAAEPSPRPSTASSTRSARATRRPPSSSSAPSCARSTRPPRARDRSISRPSPTATLPTWPPETPPTRPRASSPSSSAARTWPQSPRSAPRPIRTSHRSTAPPSTAEPDALAHPLPDALHPDTETHRLIGVRFANRVFHQEA